MAEPLSFDRPFPALTPAQRYHLDLYGYVIVPGALTPAECRRVLDALQALREKIRALPDPSTRGPRHHGAYFLINQPHHTYMGNIIASDPAITAYATHPRMVAMAEELIGGEARIVEMNAHLNRRDPVWAKDPTPKFGFHRGSDVAFAMHSTNGLVHCNFVKTLTNLTDLGPDDGGTVVIAGSHKINVPEADLIACAYEDRSLIHQVIAPAGSTLLFAETLIHATGQIRSESERAIIITGYGPPMFPYWEDGEPPAEFLARVPAELKVLIKGRANWGRWPRYRLLSEPADARPFGLGEWDDRLAAVKKDAPAP